MKNKVLIGIAGVTVASVAAFVGMSISDTETQYTGTVRAPLEKGIKSSWSEESFRPTTVETAAKEFPLPDNYLNLWDVSSHVTGIPLAPFPPLFRNNSELEKGCVVEIKKFSKNQLAGTEGNKHVSFRTPLGEFRGTVNTINGDGIWVRIGGDLHSHNGTFFLGSNDDVVSGMIILPEINKGFEIVQEKDGKVYLVERRAADLRCMTLSPKAERGLAGGIVANAVAASPAVPVYSSKPDAPAVIYIDLDGETVTDSAWNGGKTIVAAAPILTGPQILEIWNRVKEDFAVFNVDVTTNPNRYNNTPPNRRTRCIVTPTDTAAPRSGGVAYVDSFSRAGTSFSSTIPCWVFNKSTVGISEAISHEVGHTLGLYHDGRTNPREAYYGGNRTWAPIMGNSYSSAVTHWSRGEYPFADNKQDDVLTISKPANGITFIPDDVGNDLRSATPLFGSNINVNGLASYGDIDVFKLNIVPGAIQIRVAPSATVSPNLDVKVELLNALGAVLVSQAPSNTMHADINYNAPFRGVYYLRVTGSGNGDPINGGYSAYSSMGGYTITGIVPAAK